jgi:hypothetical protein
MVGSLSAPDADLSLICVASPSDRAQDHLLTPLAHGAPRPLPAPVVRHCLGVVIDRGRSDVDACHGDALTLAIA